MIDTDKYEGHSPAPWTYTLETEDKIWDEHGAVWDKNKNCLALVDDGSEQFPDADLKLIADAPLLLQEVKRLRKQLEDCKRQIQFTADWIRDRGEATHAKELDEFLEWME